jgi:hypothetical protein
MSWHCSLALVEEFSGQSYLDGEQCALLRSSRTAEKFFFDAKKKKSSKHFPSGTTSEHSAAESGVEKWMSSLPDSRANHSPSQENNSEKMTNVTFGPKPLEPFVRYNQGSAYWKTSQACLDLGISDEYLETWPRAGIMQDGACWGLVTLGHHIDEIGCGYMPTPTCAGWASEGQQALLKNACLSGRMTKDQAERAMSRHFRPTVWTTDGNFQWRDGLKLNPNYWEWMMDWGIGWTALKPLATDKFQQWLEQHGICYQEWTERRNR